MQEIKNMRSKAIDVHFPKFEEESLNPTLCSTIPFDNSEKPKKFMQIKFEAHGTSKTGEVFPMRGMHHSRI